MRIAISVITILLIIALAWFTLQPDHSEPVEGKQISESTKNMTDDNDQKVVVPPQPKSIVTDSAETTNVETINSIISDDIQDAQADQEQLKYSEPATESDNAQGYEINTDGVIIAFLTTQIENESLLGRIIQTQIIERFTTFIDNLPRKNLPRKFLPIKPPGGLFLSGQDLNGEFIAEENHERYYNYVRLLEKINVGSAIDLYVDLYPYFQKAYAQLGYPDHSFHNRLTYVIDHLLETPQKYDPIYIKRPNVLYVFADPALESLSAGQKLLLRTGAQNVRNVKRVLNRVKRQMRSPEI